MRLFFCPVSECDMNELISSALLGGGDPAVWLYRCAGCCLPSGDSTGPPGRRREDSPEIPPGWSVPPGGQTVLNPGSG